MTIKHKIWTRNGVKGISPKTILAIETHYIKAKKKYYAQKQL